MNAGMAHGDRDRGLNGFLVKTDIRGLGVFKIPVTLTVTRSGLSQRYWK